MATPQLLPSIQSNLLFSSKLQLAPLPPHKQQAKMNSLKKLANL
jgi:hypothetical protein